MSEIVIRPVETTDEGFIYKTWLNDFRDHGNYATRIRRQIYYENHSRKIDRMANRPGARAVIASLSDEPGVVLAFFVWEISALGPCVHYCYVRPEWRKMGIARRMMIHGGCIGQVAFSHWTSPCASLINRKDVELSYDPYRF